MDIFSLLLFAAIAVALAGTVKGLVGIGLPTASLSILTLAIDPRTAIALILFPMILSNAWQVWRMGEIRRTLRRYLPFGLTLALGVFLTSISFADADDRLIFLVMGIAIVAFALVNLAFHLPAIPERYDRSTQVVLGALAGVLGGLSGVWAAPMGVYLSGRQVEKDEFVRATGLLIFLGSVPLLLGYVQQGFMTTELGLLSLLLVVPTLLGFTIGERVRRGLTTPGFRKAFLYIFLFMGLNLLRRGIF